MVIVLRLEVIITTEDGKEKKVLCSSKNSLKTALLKSSIATKLNKCSMAILFLVAESKQHFYY
jgi:hypothetical protein